MTFRRVFTNAVYRYRKSSSIAFSRKYLIYTNVLLSISISTIGDLLEQTYEYQTHQVTQYDFHRTAHMGFSGGIAGIICHNWYIFLDKVIIGRTWDMAFKKLLLDQFICSPVIIMSFFASVAIFEDDPYENFTEEVADKFWTLYKAEWVVWPPAQMINFYFLPTRFRVLYDNTISLCYDVYTSHVKHAKQKSSSPHEKNELNNGTSEKITENKKNKEEITDSVDEKDPELIVETEEIFFDYRCYPLEPYMANSTNSVPAVVQWFFKSK